MVADKESWVDQQRNHVCNLGRIEGISLKRQASSRGPFWMNRKKVKGQIIAEVATVVFWVTEVAMVVPWVLVSMIQKSFDA